MTSTPHNPGRLSLEARIAAHVQAWERARRVGLHQPETRPFITISRQFGCEAIPLAERLVEILNKRTEPTVPWVSYDKELLDIVAREMELRRDVVASLNGSRRSEMCELFDRLLDNKVEDAVIFRKLAEVIRSLAMHGHAVIVGRGSYMITQNMRMGLHVRIVALQEWRAAKVAAERRISLPEADRVVAQGEQERERFLRTFFLHDPKHPFRHDLILENSRFTVEQMAEIVVTALLVKFHGAP